MNRLLIVTIGVLFLSLIGCSSKMNPFSPEEVIQNALAAEEQMKPYYAESEMTLKEKDGETETVFIKEWHAQDKIYIEITQEDEHKFIGINDGESFVFYDDIEKTAFSLNDSSISTFNIPSPKEQTMQFLEMIYETHQVEELNEEKIAGRPTYHLKATTGEKNSLLGDTELWIDKEEWLVLKMVSINGDLHTEMTYKTVDFNISIPDEKFVIDLPDDVTIESLNEETITIEEATGMMNTSFLYLPDTKDYTIDEIQSVELSKDSSHKELVIDYKKDDLPFVSLSVIRNTENEDIDTEEIFIQGEEKETIRGVDGSYFELEEFRTLSWREEDINYSLQLIDPHLTREEALKLVENMEFIK